MRHPVTNGHLTNPYRFTFINLSFIMKNAILNFALFLLLASALIACKKEPTFKDELVGHWLSTKVTVGGADITSSYAYDLRLEGSQEFSLDVTTTVPLTGKSTQTFSGDWSNDQSKQDVTLTYTNGQSKTWDIVAVSETTMTAEIIEDNTRYQVKFEKQ